MKNKRTADTNSKKKKKNIIKKDINGAVKDTDITEKETRGTIKETDNTKDTDSTENTKKKPEPLGRALLKFIIKLAVVAAIVFVLLTFVGGIFICHNNDMHPSVRDGDLLITFKLGTYHAGDVIAYKLDDSTLFGRVVGEPGDRIVIDEEGNFYINDLLQMETIYYETKPREGSQITYPYTIQSGELFVLTDMREQGYDSRVFGGVTKPLGKVVLQIRRRGF